MAITVDLSMRNPRPSGSTGIIWCASRLSIAPGTRPRICWGANRFVVISDSGVNPVICWSIDGFNWTSVNSPVLNAWNDICYGNGVYIAVSTNGVGNQILRSTDNAVTWSSIVEPVTLQYTGVCYAGNATFVACAQNGLGNQFMRSTDNGVNWTSVAEPANLAWQCIESDGYGNVIALANNGAGNQVAQSADYGANWNSRAESTTRLWTAACFGNGLLIAGNSTATTAYMYSYDNGVTWNTGNNAAASQVKGIAYLPSLHRWVMGSENYTNIRMTVSDNGLDWTDQNQITSGGASAFCHDVAASNDRFVATGLSSYCNCFVS